MVGARKGQGRAMPGRYVSDLTRCCLVLNAALVFSCVLKADHRDTGHRGGGAGSAHSGDEVGATRGWTNRHQNAAVESLWLHGRELSRLLPAASFGLRGVKPTHLYLRARYVVTICLC